MLKIIKWYIVICAMIILLSAEMAQAGRNKLEASNIQKLGRAVEGKAHNANKDLQAIANQKTRASYVTELDKAAAGWDFTNFNFTRLYEYFCDLIDHVTFLKATLAGDFSSIATLAQALVDSNHFTTSGEAKFFIYSVLKASYDRDMKGKRGEMLGFELLKQANETMASYTMDVVKYHEADLVPGYAHTMISNYPIYFLKNSAITKVQLTNQLSSLVTLVNKYAKTLEKCEIMFKPKEATKKTTTFRIAIILSRI